MNSHKVEIIPVGDLIKIQLYSCTVKQQPKTTATMLLLLLLVKVTKEQSWNIFLFWENLPKRQDKMWNTSQLLSWLTLIYKQKSHD